MIADPQPSIMDTAPPSDLLHQKAFDHSLQASIIFIVSDGRIIRVNRAACKLLGYSKKELLARNRDDIFSTSDGSYKKMLRQRKAVGSVKADLSIIRKSGRLWPCEITSVIFNDSNGVPNSVMSIVDLRERLLKQKKIDIENEKSVAGDIVIAQSKSESLQAENTDWIKSIAKSSYDVIWDWDIVADLISFGKNYEQIFGYKLPANKISFDEWINFFQPAERAAMKQKINNVFDTRKKSWRNTYPFICPDGTVGRAISRANIVRDNDGKATRMIGVIHDISKLQKLEGIIQQKALLKEKQIIEAIVEAKEMERADIGKELHDNINQLLSASILYLGMARKDIKLGEIYLAHSSEYILTAIEEIRKLSKELVSNPTHEFGLCVAIEYTSGEIMDIHPVKITCVLDYALEDTMSEKFKLNTFRIFQEQLNNILKHAKATEITVSVSKINNSFVLSMADNGIGFDPAKKATGIGLNNISSRAELYKGNARFISSPDMGCTLLVHFPLAYTR